MLHEYCQCLRPMRCRGTLAGLLASASLLGCVAVYWAESRAYADLPNDRLENLVGVKGDCCRPGLKTECTSTAPFACTTSGIVCDNQSSFDNCSSPACQDSDNAADACDGKGTAYYSVTLTTCDVIPGGEVYCETGGTHCMYTTGSATADFNGCGQNSICSVSSGPTCQ